ncbi:hypothetical protein THAOC_03869, partial [Thalassiosira oceanica]
VACLACVVRSLARLRLRSSELVEHDWKCAAIAVVVDEWRDAKTVVPCCRFACQLSNDSVEVYIDFSEPTCAHGQDLSSVETAQHGLERAHHISRTVSDNLRRKLTCRPVSWSSLAQLVERETVNLEAVSSILTGRAIL